jgi:hypothetical protein
MLFDIAMPLTLFLVTLASMLLNGKTEKRLTSSLEEREFETKDAVLLVAGMAVMISLIFLLPETALMIIFLFSYSMLLFLFTLAFAKEKFYPEFAAMPSALFIILYAFTRQTTLWSVYLINIYAVVFAVMITLYLQTLFTWKTSLVFVGLITTADIILVLVTKAMVSVATETLNLQLPVLVTVPTIPSLGKLSLGLGDFFFAGLLGIQSFKKYGRAFGFVSLVVMTISFLIYESFLLTYRIGAFPGTVMILSGWLILLIWKNYKH